jgi:hypothetical protein
MSIVRYCRVCSWWQCGNNTLRFWITVGFIYLASYLCDFFLSVFILSLCSHSPSRMFKFLFFLSKSLCFLTIYILVLCFVFSISSQQCLCIFWFLTNVNIVFFQRVLFTVLLLELWDRYLVLYMCLKPVWKIRVLELKFCIVEKCSVSFRHAFFITWIVWISCI